MRAFSWLATCLALLGAVAPESGAAAAEETPVIDLRIGLAQNVTRPARNLWQGIGQGGLVQLRRGHVEGVLAVFSSTRPGVSSAELGVAFARFRSALDASQAFDAHACRAARGRVGSWFELDAPDVLGADPDEVGVWVARGISVFSLAGRNDSALASSAFPSGPARTVGLTSEGRRVASAVLAAGALLDVANLSDTALFEVVELAKAVNAPVLATRASARSLRARAGSLSDVQLRAVAATGGIVGLSLDSDLIGDRRADLSDVLQQLEHLLRVAGPEAVALASGFETGAVPPLALDSAARYPRLREALEARGVPAQQVKRLFHDNALRVLCRAARGGEGG
jgi:microsomal dipeptidase-like Zn-dependent dipeptidase